MSVPVMERQVVSAVITRDGDQAVGVVKETRGKEVFAEYQGSVGEVLNHVDTFCKENHFIPQFITSGSDRHSDDME